MFTHYFKFFLRLISRNTYYYILIVSGLIISIATSALIYSYSKFENSFDKLHPRGDDLYRINYTLYKDGSVESINANSTPLIGPLLYHELEGVEDFSRLYPRSGSTIQILNEDHAWSIYPEDKIYHADSSLFQMFNFPLLIGNKAEILKEPFKALLSRSAAAKIFGSTENAVGKTFKLTEEETYTIEGVFDDLPLNTHLEFEILLSFSTLNILDWTRESIRTSWGWYSHYNFVRLRKNRSTDLIDEEILTLTEPHTKTISERINGKLIYTLFPVKDIYLESDLSGEMDRKGNGFLVRFMGIIAILILILAIINYVGLTASVSLTRIRETGLRKILGSNRSNLLASFVLESAVHLVLSFFIAIFLLVLFWDHLLVLVGKPIPMTFLLSSHFLVISSLFIAAISFLCGWYQHFLVTRLDLATSLKGADAPGRSSYVIRKGILFVQYLAGVSLLILTMVVDDQVRLLTKTDPGFKHKNTIAIKLRRTRGDENYFRKIKNFSSAMGNVSGITQTALSSHIPSEEIGWTSGGKITGQLTTMKFHHYAIDENFIDLYNIEMVAGAQFGDNIYTNQRSILINEHGARSLGFDDPADAINATFLYGGRETDPYKIIGVVKDYYQRGLKYQIDPIVFHYLPDHGIYTGSSYASLRIGSSGSLGHIKNAIEETWNDHFNGVQIEYSDVDQKYLDQYQSDRKAFDLLSIFTLIAIMIAAFGLVGIVAFTTKQRTKEIGIRKVLGATIYQVIFFISKSYIIIMMTAILFAWTTCYFILEMWLQHYPQRVAIDFTLFIAAALVILLISMGLIVFQSLKSGVKNPAEVMRTD